MKSRAISTRQLSQRAAFSLIIVATIIVVIPVLVIVLQIILNGASAISWDFLTQAPSQAGKAGGILPAIVGTFYLMLGTPAKFTMARLIDRVSQLSLAYSVR